MTPEEVRRELAEIGAPVRCPQCQGKTEEGGWDVASGQCRTCYTGWNTCRQCGTAGLRIVHRRSGGFRTERRRGRGTAPLLALDRETAARSPRPEWMAAVPCTCSAGRNLADHLAGELPPPRVSETRIIRDPHRVDEALPW